MGLGKMIRFIIMLPMVKEYEENAYTEEEIMDITKRIRDQITISNKAIKSNYFNYLDNKIKEYTPKEEVTE